MKRLQILLLAIQQSREGDAEPTEAFKRLFPGTPGGDP